MKLQQGILSQQGTEAIVKLKGASGRYMFHNCRMEGLGRYYLFQIFVHVCILIFCTCLYTDFCSYFCSYFIQIKKIPERHTCQSTGKVEKNSMATNHWVRDRVLDRLAKDPKIGPKALQKRLEEQYHLQLSYWVVWDGRNMALEQLKGKWDDSFEHIFSFNAEVEKTNPGSLVDIEYEKVGKKFRFTRMFVALKACVDGFLNGCRPFLGVDSTYLTEKWKGQLASATAIDGHNWMFPVCYAVFESETTANWK